MSTLKRFLALSSALCLSLTMAACGSSANDSGSSTTTTHEDQIVVEDTTDVEDMKDKLSEEERTIIWMGTYDLNQADGNETSVEMQLFTEKGGKIEWKRVVDSEKFTELAAAISANKDVPDIFKYEWMAFPAQITNNMYQPVDDIVDFDSETWKDVKDEAEKYALGGKHYVAPINFDTGVLMMYDQDVIEAEGLEDPYTTWLDGNWNWNTWRDVMEDYVANATGDEERYGVSGWFASQLVQQTGQTMITTDGTHFFSNLLDPDIERAETFLYDLSKDGLVFTDWVNSAQEAFNTRGNVLFYVMGTWALTGSGGPQEGDNWMVVPMPADPTTNAKITTSNMQAYMWVRGSTKNEAVKTWFECAHIAKTDEAYKDAARQKFFIDNPNWTDEMYDVIEITASSEYDQVFDYGYGISPVMSSDSSSDDGNCVTRKLYEYVTKNDDTGKQFTWSELRSTYSKTVDEELKNINNTIDSILG